MKREKNSFSYKKGIKKQLLYAILFFIITGIGFSLTYIFLTDVSFDRYRGDFNPIRDDLFTILFNEVKSIGWMVFYLIVPLASISFSFFTLVKFFQYLFQRERIVLAKVIQISTEISGELDDSIDSPNASLSKALAKNFKQVTIHQKAKEGKITKICIYASKTKNFSYASAKDILSHLSGICKTLGMIIEPFSQEDYNDFFNDFNISYGNPVEFKMGGLVLNGEFAYQHVMKFTPPVDALVNAMIKNSNEMEIHTFNSIRQASSFRFWLRKKNLPRTKTRNGKERSLSDEEKHKIEETKMMSKSGFVKGEVAVLVKGYLKNHVVDIRDDMYGRLETIYDGFTRKSNIKNVNPKRILTRVKNHELVANYHQMISGYSARAIINVYQKPMSGIPIVKDVTTPPSEKRPKETHPIILGETAMGEEVRTNLDDHIHHCGIFGTTGYGKSEWIQAEIEQMLKHYPDKRIMIFDFDGEYARAFANHPDFLIFEANSQNAPLHINPFGGEMDDLAQHADSLFSYLNEILSIDQKYGEFTPPQKSILWEGIMATVEAEDDSIAKNYSIFEQKIREYIETHRYEFVRGDMSEKSLMLKLKFYKRELRNVVMCNKSNFTMDMLQNTNVIFNLKSILSRVGKRAITTLLLYQLRNYSLKKETRNLWLKVYIEEAVVVTPRAEKGQMLFVEECLTVIRKLGVSFTLIGTTADEITKFILLSPYLVNTYTISDVLSKKMNIDLKLQHSLKKFRVDIKLPNEEHPIRLVKLSRPKRRKLTYDEYEHYLKTTPKYEQLRSRSLLLDDIDFQDYKQSFISKCLKTCSFNYYNIKDCLLQKKYKMIDKLKDNLREFIKVQGGLNGMKVLLESDLSEAIDKVSIEAISTLRNGSKIGHIKITPKVESQITKCAFAWLLNELIHNQALTRTEALSFLLEYDHHFDELQTSSYGFDADKLLDYTFDIGDYEDAWGEN